MTETPLRELGRALGEGQDTLLRALAMEQRARERVLGAPRPAPRRSRALAAAVALAAAALVVVGWFWLRPAPLEFTSGDAPGTVGAPIAAPVDHELAVRFSEGTTVWIAPEARARVVALESSGARVLLEEGHARAAVVHRPSAHWFVDAGPFEVVVTGTRFDVAWDPATQHFTLSLTEGSVMVSGPVVGPARPVRAGETIGVDCKAGRLETTETARATAPSLPAESAAAIPPSAPAGSVSAAVEPPAAPSWRALAASGKHAEALLAAEAAGFDSVCASASADDLVVLSDSARFAGKGSRSMQALVALRQRFPGDKRSGAAAFLMGRTAFDQRHAYGEAAQWFTTYLSEQPAGPFAREAAGRLMEAKQRLGDTAGAKAAARDYLRIYPHGPHAAVAHGLVDD